MKVIVDTTAWSLFLRRRQPFAVPEIDILDRLILEKRVQMLGIIRQELLSGIRELTQFRRLSEAIESFPDLLATSEDHVVAAQSFNACRRNGIQGAAVDFLICAQAINRNLPILTLDQDFQSYATVLPITLFTTEQDL